MKKTYKNPTLTVVKIQPMNVLTTVSATMDGSQSITTSGGFGARRGRDDFWDDVEDYE